MADVPIIDDELIIDFAKIPKLTVSNGSFNILQRYRPFPHLVTLKNSTVKLWGDGTVTGDLDEFLQKVENLDESNYSFYIFIVSAAIRTQKMLETFSQAKEHN